MKKNSKTTVWARTFHCSIVKSYNHLKLFDNGTTVEPSPFFQRLPRCWLYLCYLPLESSSHRKVSYLGGSDFWGNSLRGMRTVFAKCGKPSAYENAGKPMSCLSFGRGLRRGQFGAYRGIMKYDRPKQCTAFWRGKSPKITTHVHCLIFRIWVS